MTPTRTRTWRWADWTGPLVPVTVRPVPGLYSIPETSGFDQCRVIVTKGLSSVV